MSQKIEPLSQEDALDLEAKRKWVRDHYEPHAQDKYQTIDGKLSLLDAILSNKWIEPNETLKLQCLGITFGDALAQMLGLEWRMVEDEYGRDPSLVKVGTSIVVFPQTSISKRIEAGEIVEVFGLFKSACNSIQQLSNEGA
jgi:hypothetical protein